MTENEFNAVYAFFEKTVRKPHLKPSDRTAFSLLVYKLIESINKNDTVLLNLALKIGDKSIGIDVPVKLNIIFEKLIIKYAAEYPKLDLLKKKYIEWSNEELLEFKKWFLDLGKSIDRNLIAEKALEDEKIKEFLSRKTDNNNDVFRFDFENDVKVIIETTEGPKRQKKIKDKNARTPESNPKEIIPDSEDEEEEEVKDESKRSKMTVEATQEEGEEEPKTPSQPTPPLQQPISPLYKEQDNPPSQPTPLPQQPIAPLYKEQGNPPSQPTPPPQTPKPPVTTEEKSQKLEEEIEDLFENISKKVAPLPSSNPKTSSSSKPPTPTVPSHQPKTPTPSTSQKQGSRANLTSDASQIMAGFGEEREESSESSGRKRVKLEEDFNEKYREACLEGSAEGLIFVEQENKTVDQKELKLITEFHTTMEKQKKDKHLSWIKGYKCDLNNFSSAGASAMFNSVFPSVVNNRSQYEHIELILARNHLRYLPTFGNKLMEKKISKEGGGGDDDDDDDDDDDEEDLGESYTLKHLYLEIDIKITEEELKYVTDFIENITPQPTLRFQGCGISNLVIKFKGINEEEEEEEEDEEEKKEKEKEEKEKKEKEKMKRIDEYFTLLSSFFAIEINEKSELVRRMKHFGNAVWRLLACNGMYRFHRMLVMDFRNMIFPFHMRQISDVLSTKNLNGSTDNPIMVFAMGDLWVPPKILLVIKERILDMYMSFSNTIWTDYVQENRLRDSSIKLARAVAKKDQEAVNAEYQNYRMMRHQIGKVEVEGEEVPEGAYITNSTMDLRIFCIAIAFVSFPYDDSKNDLVSRNFHRNKNRLVKIRLAIELLSRDDRLRINRFGKKVTESGVDVTEEVKNDYLQNVRNLENNDFELAIDYYFENAERKFDKKRRGEEEEEEEEGQLFLEKQAIEKIQNVKTLDDIVSIFIRYGAALIKRVFGNVAIVGYLKYDGNLRDIPSLTSSSGLIRDMADYIDSLEKFIIKNFRGLPREEELTDESRSIMWKKQFIKIAQNTVDYNNVVMASIKDKITASVQELSEFVQFEKARINDNVLADRNTLTAELSRRQVGDTEIFQTVSRTMEKVVAKYAEEAIQKITNKCKEIIANDFAQIAVAGSLLGAGGEVEIQSFLLGDALKIKTLNNITFATLTIFYKHLSTFDEEMVQKLKSQLFTKMKTAESIKLRLVIVREYEVEVDQQFNEEGAADENHSSYKLGDLLSRSFTADILYAVELKAWRTEELKAFFMGYYSTPSDDTDAVAKMVWKREKEARCNNFIVRLLLGQVDDVQSNYTHMIATLTTLQRIANTTFEYLWIFVCDQLGDDISSKVSFELTSDIARVLLRLDWFKTLTFNPTITVTSTDDDSGFGEMGRNGNLLARGRQNNFILENVAFGQTISAENIKKLANLLVYQYCRMDSGNRDYDFANFQREQLHIKEKSETSNSVFYKQLFKKMTDVVAGLNTQPNIPSIFSRKNNGKDDDEDDGLGVGDLDDMKIY